jgi:sulfur relay (sulfurtransferase) complex TusBCD TusD component (DsrE family)
MKARGLRPEEVMEGAGQSTMDALSEATMAADKVLVF